MIKLRRCDLKQLAGERVLLRADLDVPVENGVVGKGVVRLQAAIETIRELQEIGARVIVMGHLGRPKGEDPKLSMKPVADYMAAQLAAGTVQFAGLASYKQVIDTTHQLAQGDVLVLENLRFHPGERDNDPTFAKQLSALGDVYINDAFGNCHRDHASMTSITEHVPSYAGRNVLREVEALDPILQASRKPYVAVVGGKKISSKLHAVTAILEHADTVFVGGAIATTFYVAQGLDVGASHYKQEEVALAETLMERENLVVTPDVLVKGVDGSYRAAMPDEIQSDEAIVDVGPASIKQMREAMLGADLLLWNGPLGIIEEPQSRVASDALAHAFAEVSRGKAYGVVGGGNTVGLLEELKIMDLVDHVSTGGGAMLEYVGRQALPALEVLNED